jgi:hypothetical protein
MDVKELSYTSNSFGYTLHYRGKPIGGAGVNQAASHAADGKPVRWQVTRKNMNLHSQSAQRELDHIIDGSGQQRFLDAIKKIDETPSRKR